jgi:oligosaccharide repeat unit polymerase
MTLLPILAIAALAVLNRVACRSWLAPAAFLSLFWAAYLGVAFLIRGDYPLRPEALWVIASMILAFTVGSWAIGLQPRAEETTAVDDSRFEAGSNGLRQLTVLVALLSAGAIVGVAREISLGLAAFGLGTSPAALLRLGAAYSLARYGDPSVPTSPDIPPLVYLMFVATPLGGLLAAYSPDFRVRALGAVPLLLSFVEGAVTATRAGILLGLTMWAAGFFAGTCYRHRGRVAVFTASRVVLIAPLVTVLLTVYVFFQWIRAGAAGALAIRFWLRLALTGWMGSGAAFSSWFVARGEEPLTWGGFMFAGTFDALGLRDRTAGIFSEPVVFADGQRSNIYTIWRNLITDFSIGGSWLILAVAGVLVAFGYRRLQSGDWRWSIPIALFYATIMYSPITSVLIYNSVVAAWILAHLAVVVPFEGIFAASRGPVPTPSRKWR